jgi:alpha-tubulin suppressor-like RCC1 family protein
MMLKPPAAKTAVALYLYENKQSFMKKQIQLVLSNGLRLNSGFVALLVYLYAAVTQAALTATNIAPGCAASHSHFLKSDGSLWGMGYNYFGELGAGTSNFYAFTPLEIVTGGVTTIAVGGYHSLFLKSDGSLWGMGFNLGGELGDGTLSNADVPEEIVGSGVTAIAAGEQHSLFLKSDGSLWAMGYNYFGQLGNGTYDNTNTPQEIIASGVTAIAAGGEHSLFLESDGSLWAVGGRQRWPAWQRNNLLLHQHAAKNRRQRCHGNLGRIRS